MKWYYFYWKFNQMHNVVWPHLTRRLQVPHPWCKGTKTAARSCPFTNAKLLRFFGTKLITQADFEWKINVKRTFQLNKSFHSEQGWMWRTGKIRSLPNFERRKAQGANRKAVIIRWQWHHKRLHYLHVAAMKWCCWWFRWERFKAWRELNAH